MTTKAKTTITIDPDVLAGVKAAVYGGQAVSVSAYIEHAVMGQLASEADFGTIIEEMLTATGGPPTDDEIAAARSLLSGSVV